MRAPAFLGFAAALATASLLPLAGANAQDAYTVGVTAAMTGPGAATQAPVIEMLRIYVDRLNAKGGINGHQIKLLVEDDQAEPSKAAANATKLIRQENVMLMINSSFSSTYGPVIAEAKRGKVPLWFAGAVCPKETHPPKPDPLLFCTTGFDFCGRHSGGDQGDQGHVQGAGQARPDRHPGADLAHRRRQRREDRRRARHGDGGQGVHPADHRRLHAVRHQDQRRRRRTGAMPMRRGRPRRRPSRRCGGSAGPAAIWPTAIFRPRMNWRASPTPVSTCSWPTACSWRTGRCSRRSATPRRRESIRSRRPTAPKAGSPAWCSSRS